MSDEETEKLTPDQLREFLTKFIGEAAMARFTDERLPTVKFYDDIRHGDRLRGGIGTWHVIRNASPIAHAAVDVYGVASRVVISPDVVGCTFTALNSGSEYYVLGSVQDSKIKATGSDSHAYLLGRVSGNSTIQAGSYSTAFSRQPGVAFRGISASLPEHLRILAAPDPPTRPLSNPARRATPRPPWLVRGWWRLTGPEAHGSHHVQRRNRRP